VREFNYLCERRQLSYAELDQEDFDVGVGEVAKKQTKVTAKSRTATVTGKTATTLGEAKTKGKMRTAKRGPIVLDDSDEEEEVELPQPKLKANSVATLREKAIPKKKSRLADDVLKYDKRGNEIRKREYVPAHLSIQA
jgi:hypothetical protein